MAAVKLLLINEYINNASPPLTYGLMIEVTKWPNVGTLIGTTDPKPTTDAKPPPPTTVLLYN